MDRDTPLYNLGLLWHCFCLYVSCIFTMGIRIMYQPDAPWLSRIKQYVLARSTERGEPNGKAEGNGCVGVKVSFPGRGFSPDLPHTRLVQGDWWSCLIFCPKSLHCSLLLGSVPLSCICLPYHPLKFAWFCAPSHRWCPECRAGQNLAMAEPIPRWFLQATFTLIWHKGCWLQSKYPGNNTHWVLS